MRNSVVLAGAVGADDADDAARRQLEREIRSISQPVAKTLRQVVEVDDVVAEPLGDGNDDLGGARRLLVLLGDAGSS